MTLISPLSYMDEICRMAGIAARHPPHSMETDSRYRQRSDGSPRRDLNWLASGARQRAKRFLRSVLAMAGRSTPEASALPCPAKPYDLALVAVFKNEAHILREWVTHYLSQGVDRLHLVDNDSDDDYLPALEPLIRTGAVVLHKDSRRHAQVQIYNDLLPTIRAETHWLIVCDLDEFIYARRGHSSIADYLRTLGKEISLIQLPWKMFGSSGHEQQPAGGVISSFRQRASYDDDRPAGERKQGPTLKNGKYIVRTDRAESLFIHHCKVRTGKTITSDGRHCAPSAWSPISEKILADSALNLNHYAIQSREFFRTVKMTRGAADNANHDSIRDWSYFEKYDTNEKYDDELALLHSMIAPE